MGCSLAAVADMSHLHGVRKKNTVVSVHCTNFLQLSPLTHTREHPYKLFKQHSITSVGTSFFGNRVINVWNNLAQDTVDFTTLQKFKTSLMSSDLSQFFAVLKLVSVIVLMFRTLYCILNVVLRFIGF